MTRVDLSMRSLLLSALLALAFASCAHDDRRGAGAQSPEQRASAASVPSAPPQYLIADPGGRVATSIVSLGPSTYGVTVDKTRVVFGRGEPRVAAEQTDQAFSLAYRLPARFGGGFLFTTDTMIYRAESFEGALHPVARVPDSISDVSFASKSVLIRTKNGERWSIGLPNGERIPIEPLGAADVEALDDGRAFAFNDQGAAFVSTDHGAHWNDVTASVRSSPNGVHNYSGELWLLESGGGALRLESDGRVSAFDKPPDEKPIELRVKDPRWHGRDTPLRTAFRSGAAIDEGTAIVLEGGDLVRIDVHTGDILSTLPGRAPPDAQCDAVASGGDVVFACNARGNGVNGGQGTSFVISHTTTGDAPVLEHTFASSGQFFASDDGGLAFAGPCDATSSPTPSELFVCVRQLGGSWEEHDLSLLSADAGNGADARVLRWIPRADGRVVALLSEPSLSLYDPRTGASTALPPDAHDLVERGGYPIAVMYNKKRHIRMGEMTVDHTWSYGPGGGFRGWSRTSGGSVEISDDGRITRSPYVFEGIIGGVNALGRTKDGRLFQTNDHGASWVEVASPPGATGIELRSCTSAGCDLGAFYRAGWMARPPRPEAEGTKAPLPADVRHAPRLELSCKPQGAAASKSIASTNGGEDLGLGLNRLPIVPDGSDWTIVRNVVPRTIVSPLHEPSNNGDSEAVSVRAIFSGYQATRDGDALVVQGPSKSIHTARRPVAYVPGFDPSGRVWKTSFGLGEVFAAGRAVGLSSDDLAEDMADTGSLILVTPSDPNAISDVAFNNERGLTVAVRNERARIAIRQPLEDNRVISAVALDKDETAFLEVESRGVIHVFKIGPRGTSDLFDLNATSTESTYAPANPDALGVNAKGELAVLRTPSGSDPSSPFDPAYVVTPAAAAIPLAPWSELKLADDPACKGDTSGWRTTLQLVAPWIAVVTPELHVDPSPMVARVRWSQTRVCLEGIEVRLPNVNVRVGTEVKPLATWLVAKGSTFARVGIAEGLEWRQPLECAVVPRR